MTQQFHDPRLDLWIEQNVFRRSRSKRCVVQKYSLYTNKAFEALNYTGLLWMITYPAESRYQIHINQKIELADSWEEVPLAICRAIHKAITGFDWQEATNAAQDK